jgi:hypothetical protein
VKKDANSRSKAPLKINVMRTYSLIACISLITFGCPAITGQIVAVQSANNIGGGGGPFSSDRTFGWQFTVGGSSIAVSKLGYWDFGADGLGDEHTVGIWESGGAGTLVVQGSVPAGTSGELIGTFRFTDVTPVTLNANQTYYIGGWSPSALDLIFYGSPGETIANEITYNGATYAAPEDLFDRPDISFPSANQGVYGPNFAFGPVTPVPEPEEYALAVGLGLVALSFIRKRMARSQPGGRSFRRKETTHSNRIFFEPPDLGRV